jgi:hypothetical protein
VGANNRVSLYMLCLTEDSPSSQKDVCNIPPPRSDLFSLVFPVFDLLEVLLGDLGVDGALFLVPGIENEDEMKTLSSGYKGDQE